MVTRKKNDLVKYRENSGAGWNVYIAKIIDVYPSPEDSNDMLVSIAYTDRNGDQIVEHWLAINDPFITDLIDY